MIAITDLIFEYPGHRALDGISLEIPAGSVTALVGPNGAGKSTLLRCLAGLEQPLSGQVRVRGIDVAAQPRQVHRYLGYLSDFFGLYERLTVAQGLEYAASAMGLERHAAQARVPQVAQQLDLLPLLERLPSQLSRGQRQRLAIGQAIIHQPAVLLLDEPASGLDPEARSDLAALLRQLQAQGMTLIVSSHILSELDEYCTHLLALRGGQVESHGALRANRDDAPQLQLFALELGQSLPLEQLRALVDADSVQDWGGGDQPLLLWLPAAAAQRAALLMQWVRAGLPVAGLYPQRESVQQRYIRRLPHTKEGAP